MGRPPPWPRRRVATRAGSRCAAAVPASSDPQPRLDALGPSPAMPARQGRKIHRYRRPDTARPEDLTGEFDRSRASRMAGATEKWPPGIPVTAVHPRPPAPVTRPSHQQLLPAKQADHPTSRLEAVVVAPTEQAGDNLVATAVGRFGGHPCTLHWSYQGNYDGCRDYDDEPDHHAPLSDPNRSTTIVASAVPRGKLRR